jgi:hypothetical protein
MICKQALKLIVFLSLFSGVWAFAQRTIMVPGNCADSARALPGQPTNARCSAVAECQGDYRDGTVTFTFLYRISQTRPFACRTLATAHIVSVSGNVGDAGLFGTAYIYSYNTNQNVAKVEGENYCEAASYFLVIQPFMESRCG